MKIKKIYIIAPLLFLVSCSQEQAFQKGADLYDAGDFTGAVEDFSKV